MQTKTFQTQFAYYEQKFKIVVVNNLNIKCIRRCKTKVNLCIPNLQSYENIAEAEATPVIKIKRGIFTKFSISMNDIAPM